MASAHKTHTQRGGAAQWKVARRRRLRRKRAHERNLEAQEPQTRAAKLRARNVELMLASAARREVERRYRAHYRQLRNWAANHQIG